MSELITVRAHTTLIPTRLLTAGSFRPGDQAVVETVAEGVLIRPLQAEDVLGARRDDARPDIAWLAPVPRGGAVDPLAA